MAEDSPLLRQEKADEEQKIIAALRFLAAHGLGRSMPSGVKLVYLPSEKTKILTREELSFLTTAENALGKRLGRGNSFVIIKEGKLPNSPIKEILCRADQFFDLCQSYGIAAFNPNIAPFAPAAPEEAASIPVAPSEPSQPQAVPAKLTAAERTEKIRKALDVIHWIGVSEEKEGKKRAKSVIRIPVLRDAQDNITNLLKLNQIFNRDLVSHRKGKVNPKNLHEEDRHYEIPKSAYLLCCKLAGYSPHERLVPDAPNAISHRFI